MPKLTATLWHFVWAICAISNVLDKNKNGFLSHRELANKVRYERDPCADWEEAMQKMSEQSQNQQ